MLSFKLAGVLTLLAVVRCVPVSEADCCVAKFHASLKETLTLKQTCAQAELQDCCQIAQTFNILHNSSAESDVYDISNVCGRVTNPFSNSHPIMQARCDMESDDGGWLVLARRTPEVGERVNFDRTWSEFEVGFGDLGTEYWYGLKNMHCLTSREPMKVRFDLKTTAGATATWTYNKFVIDGPANEYTLHIGEPQQNGFDYLKFHNGMKFSTRDNDNDLVIRGTSCSAQFGDSGWWYNLCYNAVLTLREGFKTHKTNSGPTYAYAEMKIRPLSCQLLTSTPGQCT